MRVFFTQALERVDVKSLQCTVHFDDEMMHPVHQHVTSHDGLVREYLLHDHRPDEGMDSFLFYVEGDRDAYEDALQSTDRIVEYTLTEITATEHYAYIRERSSSFDAELRGVLDRTGVLLVPPIEFRSDGTARVTVLGEPDALQEALDDVPVEVDVEITRVRERMSTPMQPGVDLTNRQREAIEAAVAVGYYEVPRDGSVQDVATRLGCAPGTAAEHLRKAERAIMMSIVSTSEANGS
jgi:predicted DNA binding protein